MKKKELCLGLALLTACVPAWSAGSLISDYSQKTLLKNWAFSRCLAEVHSDELTKIDAQATASAYFEFGVLPVEAYDEVSALIDVFANLKYGGETKSEFHTMKCIDLFHSKELDVLLDKLLINR